MTFNGFSIQIIQLLAVSFLKTSLILLAALVLTRLLNRSSASLRHWLLNLTLIATLLLPVLSIVSPQWSLAILPGAASTSGGLIDRTTVVPISATTSVNVAKAVDAPAVKPASQSAVIPAPGGTKMITPAAMPKLTPFLQQITAAEVLLLVWLSGVVITLTRWLVQFWLIWRVTQRASNDADWNELLNDQARLLKIRRQVRLVFSAEICIPMTWGILHPIIMLPIEAEDWDEARRGVVLRHELAHILRWDYLTQWILLLSCTIHWFNPLIWKIARQITLEREQASDDLVLNTGVRGIDYAAHLLDIARSALAQRPFQMVGLAMAQRSDLELRIRGVLDKGQPRATPKRMRLFVLALVILLMLPLGGMRLSPVHAQADSITLSLAVDPGLAEGINDQGLLNDFLSAHPGVTVTTVDMQDVGDAAGSLDDYFTALQKYASSADVLAFPGYDLALSPLATRAGYLLDLAPLVQSDSEPLQNDFYPQLWTSYQWDGGIWGLPISADLALLVYDKSAFDKAGLTYPDGSWTLDQFVSVATKLTVKDANGSVVSSGFANTGRIFREAFWRSLFTSDAVDTSTTPNPPQFNRPDISAVLDAYHQLEQQNVITSDASSAALYVDSVRKQPDAGHDWALLPGNHGVLLPSGFAVSAGTQQPELAYDLVKYLTGLSAIAGPIPARKSTTPSGGIASFASQPYQALIQQAFDHALTLSNLRFGDYLNDFAEQGATDSVLSAQTEADNDLQVADAKRATLKVSVTEPVAPTLPPGKIALKFAVNGFGITDANQKAWTQVIDDFTASDPQVGLVNLRNVQEPASLVVQQSDCFYYPYNVVPTVTDNSLLDLGPLLSADPNFNSSDFVSGVLAAVQRGDQTLALPIDIQPFILNAVPAQFQAANLPVPSSTWTVSDFNNALNALKQADPSHSPFVDTGSGGAYLLVLIASYGGLPIDFRTSPPTVNFTDPATVAAIQQVLDLARNGDIRYSALGSLEGQSMNPSPDNTTAVYSTPLNSFTRKMPQGSVPDVPLLFPRGQQFNGAAYNLGAGYISAQSQNPEACYRFLSTLAQHSELFSAMPARRSLLTDPTFTASTNPNVLALYNAFDALLQDPHTVPFDDIGFQSTPSASVFLIEHWLFEAFDSYVLNNGDLTSVLQDAQTKASGFATCAANLPPLDLSSVKPGDTSAAIPYVDCAEQVDNTLKPILDPLVGR